MKNIHILPTQRLSKLGRFIDTGKLSLRTDDDIPRGENINICITSDEEIKRGDWCFRNGIVEQCNSKMHSFALWGANAKKTILTTDPDLIKDGVQPIDDEFLEWFVKNPSCERVEVRKIGEEWIYNADVPKEEPKGVIDTPKITEECGFPKEMWKPKKETIEEAAIRLYPDNIIKLGNETSYNAASLKRKDFINGGNWAKERMYSQEEVLELFEQFQTHLPFHYEVLVKEYLKQLKKK